MEVQSALVSTFDPSGTKDGNVWGRLFAFARRLWAQHAGVDRSTLDQMKAMTEDQQQNAIIDHTIKSQSQPPLRGVQTLPPLQPLHALQPAQHAQFQPPGPVQPARYRQSAGYQQQLQPIQTAPPLYQQPVIQTELNQPLQAASFRQFSDHEQELLLDPIVHDFA